MEHVIKNPIIPGFYPDPSICRVGGDFYMVCSSFEVYPGIPIFHSRDLANWEQIGHAMTMENGFHVDPNTYAGGVMAPTIRYHQGTFYIINCNFADDGNFIVTAKDPAGPWSEPHWLRDVPGIDASFFFDEDGKCYIMGTGDVVKHPDGTTERGIWAAEYDIEGYKLIGEPVAIWDSALRGAGSPEAPHIYKIGEYYYLMIAEGGTEHYHAVTVARSKTVLGWYEGNPANPVMTHRQFGFDYPIGNVGHADFVDTPEGNWYAVMLASRTIEGIHKNLGRETYICPVLWERDWPIFSPRTGKLEWEYPADESLPWTEYPREVERDEFDQEELAMYWAFWGTPYDDYWRIGNSRLYLKCLPHGMAEDLKGFGYPKKVGDCVSFLGRRQRQINFNVSLSMEFMPKGAEAAGFAVMQASNHQIRVERAVAGEGSLRPDTIWQCRQQPAGTQVLRLVLSTCDFDTPPYFPNFTSKTNTTVLAEVPWDKESIVIRLRAVGERYVFSYGENEVRELPLGGEVDGKLINPEKVGGMVGTLLGMFATSNRTESGNEAAFDWFWYEEKM